MCVGQIIYLGLLAATGTSHDGGSTQQLTGRLLQAGDLLFLLWDNNLSKLHSVCLAHVRHGSVHN